MTYIQIPDDSYKFLQTLAEKYPEQKETLTEIEGNLTQRLWHQLANNLNLFASSPNVQNSTDLIDIYNSIIFFVESALNPMKLLNLIQKILPNYKGKMDEGLTFIENLEKKFKFTGEELIYNKILKGFCYLNLGRMYDLEDTINLVKEELENKSEIEGIIYSNFYRLCAYYYEKKENYDQFYLSAFQYLAYENTISNEEKINLSFSMCVASLIGEKMFNFTELIEKDFFKLMHGTQNEWIYNLILSFNSSKVDQFLSMMNTYSAQIAAVPILSSKISFLEMKIRIAALLDLVFQKNKNERSITYKEISEVCKVDYSKIEYIVMKALSLELIKGTIDEVEKKVIVTWIQPKYLDKEKLTILKVRFDNWIDKASKMLTNFQEMGAPLLNV